jgi:hypothetical protein
MINQFFSVESVFWVNRTRRDRRQLLLLLLPLLISMNTAFAVTPQEACEIDRSGITCVPNVVDQFNKLALRPEALGFNLGNSPEPEQCKHYQGLARRNGAGVPYLFVSRSGNEPDGVGGANCTDSDDPGNLLIVRLGSRDTNGERLRSNRLVRNWDIDGADRRHPQDPTFPWPTPPDSADRTVRTILFDGTDGWPAYGHLGGLQLIGDVLAIPLEARYDPGLSENSILFVDVSDPEHPLRLSEYDPGTGSEFSAGLVGITPVLSASGECCQYLMLITGKKNKEVRLYKSLPTGSSDDTDLAAPDLDWLFVDSWTESEIETCLGGPDWHTGLGDAHQNLNFVREGSIEGALFLIGGRNTTALPSGSDYLDLYRVHVDAQGNPANCLLTLESSKNVTSKPIIGGGDSANLAAASSVYVSPSGELLVYSTEYENDGPWTQLPDGDAGRRSVRFSEWRHRQMVRPQSPTLKPGIAAGGPYEVEEGDTVTLNAAGAAAITQAWLQLFEDDGLGLSLPGLVDKDDWLAVDYADWQEDNFDDFRKLHYSDDAGSWRWFAHQGCTMRANDDDFGDGNFPGRYSRTLYGTGQVKVESDLDSVANDAGDFSMDDEITSMQFFPDCDAYYGASIAIAWDFDGDNHFETGGDNPVFDAATLDGPDTVTLQARAEHPTDPTSLGRSDAIPVQIQIINVAPTIGFLAIADVYGNEIGVDVLFTLTNVPVTAQAGFNDPGLADTHTATLAWGDGSIDSSADFDQFTDATGGIDGQLSQRHAYSTEGDFSVQLSVLDDDGGLVQALQTITVVSAIGALGSVLEQLDNLIDSSTDNGVISALNQARNAIDGNNMGKASNGALDKLEADRLQAALVKIGRAIEALIRAEDSSAQSLDDLKNALGLAAESIVRGVQADLIAAIPMPDNQQAEAMLEVDQSIAEGHALLLEGDYLTAIVEFRHALGMVEDLLG